jgi:hypothetical protein
MPDTKVCYCEITLQYRKSYENEGRGVSISIVTRIRIRRPVFDSRQRHEYFLFATAFETASGPTQNIMLHFPQGYSGRVVKLTTHLYLVSRLRMLRAIPALSHISSLCGAWLSSGCCSWSDTKSNTDSFTSYISKIAMDWNELIFL